MVHTKGDRAMTLNRTVVVVLLGVLALLLARGEASAAAKPPDPTPCPCYEAETLVIVIDGRDCQHVKTMRLESAEFPRIDDTIGVFESIGRVTQFLSHPSSFQCLPSGADVPTLTAAQYGACLRELLQAAHAADCTFEVAP